MSLQIQGHLKLSSPSSTCALLRAAKALNSSDVLTYRLRVATASSLIAVAMSPSSNRVGVIHTVYLQKTIAIEAQFFRQVPKENKAKDIVAEVVCVHLTEKDSCNISQFCL